MLAVLPLSCKLLSVRPNVGAVSGLLVFDVTALVAAAVGPEVPSGAVKLVGFPAALVMSAISPIEYAFAFDLILGPLAFVDTLARKLELTISMLHSVDETAEEDAAVLELLAAWPVLNVTLPEAKIHLTIRV